MLWKPKRNDCTEKQSFRFHLSEFQRSDTLDQQRSKAGRSGVVELSDFQCLTPSFLFLAFHVYLFALYLCPQANEIQANSMPLIFFLPSEAPVVDLGILMTTQPTLACSISMSFQDQRNRKGWLCLKSLTTLTVESEESSESSWKMNIWRKPL